MESTTVYIPIDRRQAIARGEELPDRTSGAALFADISGFTPFTTTLLDELGPKRGPEELTRQLNLVYDTLIAEVHRFGGSVMIFSGDAITCWLDGDNGLRAIACGLAMQQAMKYFSAIQTPAGNTVSLGIKVAIATGPVRRFRAGDPQIQYIDALAGATIEQMVEAEHHAQTGEVVVDAATIGNLANDVDVAMWRKNDQTNKRFAVVSGLKKDTPPFRRPPLSDDALKDQAQAWMLPPVYQRLRSGQGRFLAELRPTLALFLRFGGIDYDGDEVAGEKLDDYIRWVQNVLARYEAYLLQLTIGDKGSYLYAAFGAPVAHEDDAERAMSAALELRRPPASLDFIDPPQIGISHGQMLTGAYGGTTRCTYGVLGDEVNMAARLMQAAQPGQVLVSRTAQQFVIDDFIWSELPPLKVKGKADLVKAFSLEGQQKRRAIHLREPEYTLPMVGREAELALVAEKMEQVLFGHGQLVGVTAEAGMGKSRMVAEIIRTASSRGLTGYGGECQSFGTNISYLVWQPIWQGLFGIDPTWDVDAQIKEVDKQLTAIDPALVPRLPLLGSALNLPIPDNDLTQSFDAKLRKSSLESLLVECLRVKSKQTPLLLVLEDCHWLDPLSHDLLEIIARTTVDLPVLLVMNYRPPDIERLQSPRVSQLAHFTEIELNDFSPENAEQLITLKLDQLFGNQNEISPTLVEQITTRAGGNPFYIEELLNYLQDQGFDPYNTEMLDQIDLPTSLHSLILSRIDQLKESQKSTLKVASVIGRLFRAAWLWGVSPELGDQERIKNNLEDLNRLDLTPMDTPEPELAYLFKHVVTQEVAYESLPYATRAMLHGQLGQFIEQTYNNKLDQYINLLAFHYDRSENQPKKREYLRKAGEIAQAEYANEAAIDYYQRVLLLLPPKEQEPIMVKLGEVLGLLGRYDEALAYYNSARKLLEAETDERPANHLHRLAELAYKMATVYHRRSDYETALEWLEKGLSYLDENEPTIELARLYNILTLIYRHQGKNEEALDWCQKSLTTTSKIKTHEGQRTMAHTYFNMGAIYWRRGDLTEAVYFCRESVQLYQQLDDIVGLSDAYLNLSNVYADQGHWDQAVDALRQGLDLKQKIGDIYGQGMMANNLGYIHLDRGEWAEAATLFEQCHDIWQQIGAARDDANTLSNLGQVRIYQENWAEAFACLNRSEALFAEIGSEEFLPELERRWGEYYLRTSELDQALEHTRRSVDLAVAQEARLEEGMSYRILGQIHMARGEQDLAKIALDQSLQILTDLNSKYEAAKTIMPLVSLALRSNPTATNREQLVQAIATFADIGAKADLAQARSLEEQLR